MPGSDVIIAWVDDETGDVHFDDRKALENARPPVDDNQDYYDIRGKQTATTIDPTVVDPDIGTGIGRDDDDDESAAAATAAQALLMFVLSAVVLCL